MSNSPRIQWRNVERNAPHQLEHAASTAPAQVAPTEPTTPLLDEMGRDLTYMARAGRLDPVFGRERELKQIQRILIRKRKNNPLVVGAPGVGKTALVEGLALLIARKESAEALRRVRIVELPIASLTAGTPLRGSFELRLQQLIAEASSDPNLILFLDEVHLLVRAGAVEGGALDAANILKPALARGTLRCIGATTSDEFDRFIHSDSAFERRFEPLLLAETEVSETIEILKAERTEYENHHGVTITDDALETAVRLSVRYIHDRFLPDKAFDLLDNACVLVRLPSASVASDDHQHLIVNGDAVANALSEKLGIPPQRLDEDFREKLAGLEAFLNSRVLGQPFALRQMALSIERAYVGLGRSSKPKGLFGLFGGSGVGKTATAKALAEFLFGSPDACIRLDMSEYKEPFTVSRLWGSPPGYVGYQDEGTIATRLRRQPFAVVLLDEFEKAHPEVQDAFLQIFDEGLFTDARGRIVNARETIFILTSNLVAFGDIRSEESYAMGITQLRNRLVTMLRPELINRIDDLVLFGELSVEELGKIAEKEFAELNDRMKSHHVRVLIGPAAIHWLAEKALDPNSGVRSLQRLISDLVIEPISRIILHEKQHEPRVLEIAVKDEQIELKESYPT